MWATGVSGTRNHPNFLARVLRHLLLHDGFLPAQYDEMLTTTTAMILPFEESGGKYYDYVWNIFHCMKNINVMIVNLSILIWIFKSPFRILNKLTPEKFDKLSLELLNVGIESHVILKGIILLVSTCCADRLNQHLFPQGLGRPLAALCLNHSIHVFNVHQSSTFISLLKYIEYDISRCIEKLNCGAIVPLTILAFPISVSIYIF